MIRVYLSGPISSLSKEEYTENFERAERFYTTSGFEVVNPVKIGEQLLARNKDASYEDFMMHDIAALRTCSHIALLPGWESSKGAKIELAEAERLGLEVMHLRLF